MYRLIPSHKSQLTLLMHLDCLPKLAIFLQHMCVLTKKLQPDQMRVSYTGESFGSLLA